MNCIEWRFYMYEDEDFCEDCDYEIEGIFLRMLEEKLTLEDVETLEIQDRMARDGCVDW